MTKTIAKHPSRRRIVRTVDDLPRNHWMVRQLPAGTSLRRYAEDRAVSTITRSVQGAIDAAGLSRSDVADALGTTKSYVSQVLNGSTNMTLRTLGAVMWAAGRQINELWHEPVGVEARMPIYAMALNPNKGLSWQSLGDFDGIAAGTQRNRVGALVGTGKPIVLYSYVAA